MIYVKPKQIVIPGEVLGEGMDIIPGEGTIREGRKIIATVVGLADISGRVLKIIPLEGPYNPKPGHVVIGEVVDIGFSGWIVNIGGPYMANLPVGEAVKEYVDLLKTDLSRYYDLRDKIVAKVISVTRSKNVQLSMKGPGLRKLEGGHIIKITSYKVPRVIGKGGSMIKLIKEMTNTAIIVGQNGWIWIKGSRRKDELKAIRAIYTIEKESHTSGLTDKIKRMLGDKSV